MVEYDWSPCDIICCRRSVGNRTCSGLKKGLIGKRLTGSLIVEMCEVKQTSRVRTPPIASKVLTRGIFFYDLDWTNSLNLKEFLEESNEYSTWIVLRAIRGDVLKVWAVSLVLSEKKRHWSGGSVPEFCARICALAARPSQGWQGSLHMLTPPY